MTRKWFKVNYLSNRQYSVNENLRFKTPMSRSDLRDNSAANNVVKGTIDHLAATAAAAAAKENDRAQKNATFKTNAPFRIFISKNHNTDIALIDIAEDFDIVMLMYFL